MKRAVALVMVLCAFAGAHASADVDGGRNHSGKRTVKLHYEDGAIQFVGCSECPSTFSRPGERFLSVEVIDDTSPVGFVDISWDEDSFAVCGETTKPQRIPSGEFLTAYPWRIPDWNCPNGFTTSGTIKLTFSRTR